MTEEVWLPVVGYEGLYEVSSLGVVRSIDRIVRGFSARAGKEVDLRRKGKVIAKYCVPGDYMTVCLSKNGKAKTWKVAILVCAAFGGEKRPNDQACHCNGDRQDDRASNLRWDSAKANQADRIQHGTDLRGDQVLTSKLTPEQVVEVLEAKSPKDVKHLPIARSQYYRIKRREAWRHMSANQS